MFGKGFRSPLLAGGLALAACAALSLAPSAGASTFPGTNGPIVFDQSTGTGINAPTTTVIFATNADGTDAHAVTSGGADLDPRVSADGRWIVFERCCFQTSSMSQSASHLMIVRTDGTDLTDLSLLATPTIESTNYSDAQPSFSPDGSTIVFARTDEAQYQALGIFKLAVTLPASGPPTAGSATQITNGNDVSPTVSSNGKLAFARNAPGFSSESIYVAPSICSYPCTTATQLTTPDASGSNSDAHPDFSPDGSEVVFDRNFGGAQNGLFEVSAGGGTPVLLAANPSGEMYMHPSFSPDGKQIVFDEDTSQVGPGGSPAYALLTMAATPGAAPTQIPGFGGGATQSNQDPDYSIAPTPLRSTQTNAGCPQDVAGSSVTCSVSVTDTGGGTASSPRGIVSWSSSSGGASGFTAGGVCQLQPAAANPAASTCDIGYSSPDGGTATDQIAVRYSPSDGVHAASSDTIQEKVIAPPQATTQPASYVSSSEIDLQGVVSNAEGLDTRYYFQYGPDLNHMVQDQPTYPGTDIGSSATPSQPVPVSAVLRSLSPNTTYCFRLVAVNAAGTTYAHDAGSGDPGTNDGLCQQTSGPPIAPLVDTGTESSTSMTSMHLAGTVNPEGQPTTWFYQYSQHSDISGAGGGSPADVAGEVPQADPGMQLVNPGGSLAMGTAPVGVSADITGLDPDTVYYYRLVGRNGTGATYGPIQSERTFSNDTGFRPTSNGFSFCNYGMTLTDQDCNTSAVTADELSADDLVSMFGRVVCVNSSGACVLTSAAQTWLQKQITFAEAGHCQGFSIYSQFLFNRQVQAPFAVPAPTGGGTTFAAGIFGNTQLQHQLAIAQAFWLIPAVYNQNDVESANNILAKLRVDLHSGDEHTLALHGPGGGHNVLPYAIQQVSADTYRVYVYNSNDPGDNTQYVTFNTTAGTWTDTVATGLTWSGTGSNSDIALLDAAGGLGVQPCPFCTSTGQALDLPAHAAGAGSGINELALTGDPHNPPALTVSDAEGRQDGLVNGQLVNAIPGSKALLDPGGVPGLSEPPADMVPAGTGVAMHIAGVGASGSAASSASMIGPGYEISANGLHVPAGASDALKLAGNGTSFTFSAGPGQAPVAAQFEIAREVRGIDYRFAITGPRLAPGAKLSARLDPATLRLTVLGPKRSHYTVTVQRTDHRGKRTTSTSHIRTGGAVLAGGGSTYIALACSGARRHGVLSCAAAPIGGGTSALRRAGHLQAILHRGHTTYGIGHGRRPGKAVRVVLRLRRALAPGTYNLRLGQTTLRVHLRG